MHLKQIRITASSIALAAALVTGTSIAAHAVVAASTPASLVLSQTAFVSNSTTPAFSATMSVPNSNPVVDGDLDINYLYFTSSASGIDRWTLNEIAFPNCISSPTLTSCGVTFTINGVTKTDVTVSASTYVLQISFPDAPYPMWWAVGPTSFVINFPADFWNTKSTGWAPLNMTIAGNRKDSSVYGGVNNATYIGWFGGGIASGGYSATANSSLTFDGNGSSDTMQPQSGYNTRAITANTLTKPGYTFAGWATSQANANAGTVAYADAASYNFVTGGTRTLYAVWATQPAAATSTAAGTTTSSSDNLASTGSNNSHLFGYAGALALALMALGGVMVAARRFAKK